MVSLALLTGCGDNAAPAAKPMPSTTTSHPLSTNAPTALGNPIGRATTDGGYVHDDTTVYTVRAENSVYGLYATTVATAKPAWTVPLPDGGVPVKPPVMVTAGGRTLVVAAYSANKPSQGTTAGYGYVGLTAVDTGTGKPVWTTEAAKPGHGMANLAVVGQGSTLAVTWSGLDWTTAVIDAATGRTRWQRDGFMARAVDGGVVVGAADSRAQALAVEDAHPVWSYDKPLANLEIDSVAPGLLLIGGLGADQVNQLLDPATGAVKASIGDGKTAYRHAFLDGKDVIVLTSDIPLGGDSAVAVLDKSSLTMLWTLPDKPSNRVAPTVSTAWHGVVYGTVNNKPVAVDARTGKDVSSSLPCAPDGFVPGFALCPVQGVSFYPLD